MQRVLDREPAVSRLAFVAILALVFVAQVALAQPVPQGTSVSDDAAADREMLIGREHIAKKNFIGAINRFKIVVTQYKSSPFVPEALTHLAESYMALGIVSEAQTAVAVQARCFPSSDWYTASRSLLRSSQVEAREDAGSWLSKACRPAP
jgi:outer membrane protein assembly factor BamD